MSERINIHKVNIDSRKQSLTTWNIPECEKIALLRFLNDLELGKVNKGKRISDIRRMKYLDSLKIPFLFFNKPSEELILKDIEKFEIALSSGQIKSNKNKNYAHNTKVDIRRSLRWRLGKENADKLTDWLDTRDIAKTPDYLKEQQVEKLFKACKTSHERFLIAILFDSGARASEFHNIRFEDITFPDGKDNYPKLTLKEEYSKTKGRTISLYWKYSLDAVRDYLRERELQGIRAEDPVYDRTYDSVRMFLLRLGKRVLKRQIHPHLFRHSSATYYATKLNRQQLCYRYGWTFSSNMPDIYISRAGMQDNELDEKFSSTTIEELKSIIEKQQQQNQLIKEKQEQLDHGKKLAKKQKVKVNFVRGDFQELREQFNPSSFDIAMSAYALQYCSTLESMNRTFQQIHEILTPEGIFVFSLDHPVRTIGYWEEGTDRFVLDKYFDRSQKEWDYSFPETGVSARMRGSFKTVGDIVNGVLQAGFKLEQMLEPEPVKQDDNSQFGVNSRYGSQNKRDPYSFDHLSRIPGTLIIKARK